MSLSPSTTYAYLYESDNANYVTVGLEKEVHVREGLIDLEKDRASAAEAKIRELETEVELKANQVTYMRQKT